MKESISHPTGLGIFEAKYKYDIIKLYVANMFKIGQKVKISHDFTWARSEFGVISCPPSTLIEYDVTGYTRTVNGVNGPILFYYIEFERPQFDADGDGPYRGAEIAEKYLIPIEDKKK